MTENLDEKRLMELAESEHRELHGVYCKLRDLKSSIDTIRDDYLQQARPPEFDKVEALYLMVNDLYGELERYILPASDPESAYNPVDKDLGEGTICPR